MKLLIWGGGFVNKGAEAMLRTVQTELQARIPNIEFGMEAIEAERELLDDLKISYFARSDTPWFEPWEKWLFRWKRRSQVNSCVEKYDGLIDISGYAFGGNGCARATWRLLAVADRMRKKGKPVIFMPQAWGPFNDDSGRKAVGKLLEVSSMVFARDEESLGYINELTSSISEKLLLSPDVAFVFESASKDESDKVLSEIGISAPDKPIVVISPNQRVYEKMEGEGAESKYLHVLLEVCNFFIKKTDANLALLPHEIRFPGDSYSDDRELCSILGGMLNDGQGRVGVMSESYSAAQIKSVIAKSELVIGSRYHGLIAGLSQSIPVVAIGWSHKYNKLLGDCGLSEYVIPFEEAEVKTVVSSVEHAWLNRKKNSLVVEEYVKNIKENVRSTFDKVALMIGNIEKI
mgnify:CR=1 FL=1